MGFSSLLSERQSQVWHAEKRLIRRLLDELAAWEAEKRDLEILRQALEQLDELFLLVVVGEFNSGKSAVINALLGEQYLPEGVTPTTDRVYIVKYGAPGPPQFLEEDIQVVSFPSDLLREMHIVDTPGTNAVLRRHEAVARDFVPRSDLVIFVTSADRPFSESERGFMEAIREWGKKILVAINKIDILESGNAVAEVVDYVRAQVQRLLGFEPEIFPVSARAALRHTLGIAVSSADRARDGFDSLRDYLITTLGEESRVRLKLQSPIGVADRVLRRHLGLAQGRQDLLQEDIQALAAITQDLATHQAQAVREFDRHLAAVEAEMLAMRIRGEEFLDDRMRLLKIRGMLNAGRMQAAFESQVIADTPGKIEARIQQVIDWLVDREHGQWKRVADALGHRRDAGRISQTAQEAWGSFSLKRHQLLQGLGAQAERTVASYDRKAEALRLASSVQESVAMVGLIEVGALGLGLVLKALLVGAAAEVTGLLAAGVLGILGLAVIPYRRGVAKKRMRAKMEGLRVRLKEVLGESFREEMEQTRGQVESALEPYHRFVLDERGRLAHLHQTMLEIREHLGRLRAEIEERGLGSSEASEPPA